PDLDPDDAVGRLRFREAVVDVGAQGVQGHTAFAVPLGTGDLDAVQTARGHDLDALGAQAHGVLHGALHGAAEHDALFELLGDRVGDQLRVGFRLADFLDVDVHGHAHQALQVGLQRFDVLAATADHHARTSRVHGDARGLGGALDDDAAHGSGFQFLLHVFTNADGFGEHAAVELVVRIPARSPGVVARGADPNRGILLPHRAWPGADLAPNVAARPSDARAPALGPRGDPPHRLGLADVDRGALQSRDVRTIIVSGIGDGRCQRPFQ